MSAPDAGAVPGPGSDAARKARSSEQKRLRDAVRMVGAKDYQIIMAGFLLGVNGIDNALEYLHGLQERGLTMRPRTDAETGGRDVD